MNRVALVTINFNSHQETIALLESLIATKRSTMELSVIVVDNASSPDSTQAVATFIEAYKKKVDFAVTFIANKENKGFAGGSNCGILYAMKEMNTEYVLLVNNDTILQETTIEKLLEGMQQHDAGIVSPKIYFAKGYEFHKDRYDKKDLGKVIWYAGGIIDWANVIGFHKGVDDVDKGQFTKVEEIDFASGCCMLIKKSVIEKIGMLDEKYFLYYEDSDYSIRAKKVGFSILIYPQAILWHKNAGSAGGSGSSLQDYYITRNRLLFGMRYAPLRSKYALIKESIQLLQRGRVWQKRGIVDFYKRNFGKGSFT